jgi:hypothetical protein
MNFSFTPETLARTARFDRELRLQYFSQQLEKLQVELGNEYSLDCNLMANRFYTLKAVFYHKEVDLMTMDCVAVVW